MDYARIYSAFIASRRSTEDTLEAFDRHHIVPRCLGGSNDPENIIKLSFGDHLFAHVLLAKMHGGVLVQSAVRMSGMLKYNGGRRSRERYQHLRLQLRRQMLGNKHCEGRRTGPDTSEKKRQAWTPEMRERQRQRMIGNTHGLNRTPEMRAKLSEAQQRRYARERAEGLR